MSNPYPGLRPFKYEESYLFFGREGQSEDLLRKLEKSHFVAVVGTSGSGKSSLVRAGLLPLLSSGFMPNSGSDWRVAVFRPGDDPIHNLAEALINPGYSDEEQNDDPLNLGITETILRRSAIGISDYVNSEEVGEHESLLIVVDQFEELFRFRRESKFAKPDEEAAAFVKLLLEATKDKSGQVYVVITMRSDFLGDCARFRDLPEAINEGQYLIPRLTRDELRQVIESPAKVHGAEVSPALVTHLLNEIGDDQDQLPVLQHALMRTWDHWDESGNAAEEIGFENYRATGGMKKALSMHADEAFGELSEKEKVIAEKLFKTITEIDRENRETRRATSLEKICAIEDSSAEDLIPVIDTFRQPGRTFLMPPHTVKLNRDSLIDISHESLIRKWSRLHDWVEEEAESAQTYRRLAEDALLHKEGKAGFWSEPGLSNAVEWRESFKPNEDWAGLYYRTWGTRKLSDYYETMAYLDASKKFRDDEAAEEERLRNRKVRRLTVYFSVMAVMSILMIGLASFAYYKRLEAAAESTKSAAANKKATKTLISGYIENGRQELNNGYPFRASVFLSEAYQMSSKEEFPISERLRLLLGESMKAVNSLRLKLEHTDEVFSADLSSDGEKIVTASDDDTATIWDFQTGNRRFTLKHDDDVASAKFSPDGSMVITASDDSTARIWNAETGKLLSTLKHEGDVILAKFAVDGSQVLTATNDGTAKIWNKNGDFVRDTNYKEAISKDPASANLEIDKESKTVIIRDSQRRLSGHRDDINSAEFSPDRSMIVTTSRDKTAKIWDSATGMLLNSLEHQNSVAFGRFSPDGKQVVTGGEGNYAWVWNVAPEKNFESSRDQDVFEQATSYSKDGKRVASAVEKEATVWDTGKGRIIDKFELDENENSIQLSPDGTKLIITGRNDKDVRIWNVGTRNVVVLEHSDSVDSAIFSPDSKYVVTVVGKKAVVWSAQSGEQVTLIGEQAYPIESVRISSDRKTIITSNAKSEIMLWNAENGDKISLWTDTDEIRTAEFSPDGKKIIATSGDDESIRIWSIDEKSRGDTIAKFGDDVEADFAGISSDGNSVVSVNDKTVTVWDVKDEKVIASLEHDEKVKSAKFSPGHDMIVTASDGKIIRIWDIELGKILVSFEHRYKIEFAEFSLDSDIMTRDEYENVKVWNLARESRNPDQISEIVKKNVPLQLEDGRLVPPDGKPDPPQPELTSIATPQSALLLPLGLIVFLIVIMVFAWKSIRRRSSTDD